MNAYQRAVELVRAHAAATTYLNQARKCAKPKSVEFFHIDEHDDVWGMSDNCLYRVDDGQCERFPGRYDAMIALEVIRRTKRTYMGADNGSESREAAVGV